MTRLGPLALAAAFVVLLLSGCVQQQGASTSSGATGPGNDTPAGYAEHLGAAVPAFNGNIPDAVTWWESFVSTYAGRVSYTPVNQMATDAIAARVRSFGMETTVLTYPGGAVVANAPAGPGLIHVVVGKKVGATEPKEAIAIGGHYDHFSIPNDSQADAQSSATGLADPSKAQDGLLQAAYDNGSGTAVVMSLCEALSKLKLDKTLLCLFFDGEEFGVVGSSQYLAMGGQGDLHLSAYLGFDMVGINWPGVDTTQPQWANWKLYAWTGPEFADALQPFVNTTVHQVLGYPDTGAEVFNFNDRNSDEASFAAAHVPTIRFAGGRTAGLYPRYHEVNDNVGFVYGFMGGRAKFEQGFGAVVKTAYTVAAELDKTSVPFLMAQAKHSGLMT